MLTIAQRHWINVVACLVSLASLASLLTPAVAKGNAPTDTQPSVSGLLALDDNRVEPGRTVNGKLVIENRTSKTLDLLSGCGAVDGFYAIGLRAADGYIQEPAFATVGCGAEQEMVAKPGRTVFQFKIKASYTACSQLATGQRPRRSRYWNPICLKDSSGKRDIMPPLPAGRYEARFFPNGKWLGPKIADAKLTVT